MTDFAFTMPRMEIRAHLFTNSSSGFLRMWPRKCRSMPPGEGGGGGVVVLCCISWMRWYCFTFLRSFLFQMKSNLLIPRIIPYQLVAAVEFVLKTLHF